MHNATQTINDASTLAAEALPSDRLGTLTDETVRVLKASGGVRLLQAEDLGGFEEHPNEFVDWVMAVAERHPAAGWVAGVVGVHPWEVSIMHPTLQQEIYGADPDTWTASPYAPFGRAVPVDGGYLLTGDWPYSTGTDHCEWVILGGFVTDAAGVLPPGPPDMRHFVLPRADYEIVDDSWNVMGLRGTGSKNVRMASVFVPEHRVTDAAKMIDGVYAAERRPGNPLYGMMFGLVFPAAIAASTLGIAAGYVHLQHQYVAGRASMRGAVAKVVPQYLSALACAESDLAASTCHFKHNIAALYDHVAAGNTPTARERLNFRRDQVRATDRVFESTSVLSRLAGSAGIQEANDLERWWRDLQTAITHVCNVREESYVPWGLEAFGSPLPPGTLF